MIQMNTLDRYGRGILTAYEKGASIPVRQTQSQLGAFRDAARATSIKNRRVNIRLSAADLMDIQARAYEEGVPYQTLIASVLHKHVHGARARGARRKPPRSLQARLAPVVAQLEIRRREENICT